MSARKGRWLVVRSRSQESLCWMSGWSKTVTFGKAGIGVRYRGTGGGEGAWERNVHGGVAGRRGGVRRDRAREGVLLMDQDTMDKLVLEAAFQQALKSRGEGGIPIGSALATRDGVIVGLGHNLRVQTGDSTAHAETVCVRNAGRRRDWHTLVLASTLSPCAMCSGTAVLYRIPRVVIGENRTFQGREDWLKGAGVQVRVLDDPRCAELMREFIAARPELWNEDIGVPPSR